ncbi:MAG TPA: hypothetical protein VLD19_02080, partial [Chitinophagaceae bacterium]|nr:hypothetical protein [Chitinophagaceae bacterium]
IVIVSKKGRFGQRTRVHFTNSITVGDKPDLGYFPVISGAGYAGLERRLFDNGYYNGLIDDKTRYPPLSQGVEIMLKQRLGLLPAADAASLLDQLQQNDIRTDIRRYFLQNRVNQQYAANASGGTDKFNYYCSLGYDHNRSNSVGEDYSRLTIRLEDSWKPVKNLELNGYVVYTKTDTRDNNINYMYMLPTGEGGRVAPYTRLADANGKALPIPWGYRMEYVDTISQPGLLDWHYRPLDELHYSDLSYRQSDTRLGAGVKYRPLAGMVAEIKYQYEKGMVNNLYYNSLQTYLTRNLVNQYMFSNASGPVYPVPPGGIADFGTNELGAWNLRGQLSFNRNAKKYSVALFTGFEIREVNVDVSLNRKYGYDPAVNSLNRNIDYNTKFSLRPFGLAPVPDNDLLSGTLNRYVSYFAKLGYIYKNRYSFSASGRVDESNFFGVKANRRWVPLWSAGLGWELSNEAFYGIAWLPYLKIRATYGYNGNTNNNATAFATIRYVSPGASSLVAAPYAQIVSPPNPALRWEKIRIATIGADFENRRGSFGGSLEYYRKTGLDLISQVTVDPTTGF